MALEKTKTKGIYKSVGKKGNTAYVVNVLRAGPRPGI
jgi:hypothetical protein